MATAKPIRKDQTRPQTEDEAAQDARAGTADPSPALAPPAPAPPAPGPVTFRDFASI